MTKPWITVVFLLKIRCLSRGDHFFVVKWMKNHPSLFHFIVFFVIIVFRFAPFLCFLPGKYSHSLKISQAGMNIFTKVPGRRQFWNDKTNKRNVFWMIFNWFFMTWIYFLFFFFEIMKIYRFYKHFCPSGDDIDAKRRQRQRLPHVHLEQGFLMFWHFCGSSNVFFFLCIFYKTHQFLLSQMHYWVCPFSNPFFNYFDGMSKCEFGAHPKYWKNIRFYKHFSLAHFRCSHIVGSRNACFCLTRFLLSSQKHQFLLSRLAYGVVPFSTVLFLLPWNLENQFVCQK